MKTPSGGSFVGTARVSHRGAELFGGLVGGGGWGFESGRGWFAFLFLVFLFHGVGCLVLGAWPIALGGFLGCNHHSGTATQLAQRSQLS